MKTKSLELKVKIPGPAVKLFQGMSAISGLTPEQMASRAIMCWLKSEDAMNLIDDEVNALLRE